MKRQNDVEKERGKSDHAGELTRENPWVWVVVQDPGGNERFVGLKDQEKDIWFVPTFRTKDEALEGLMEMPREKGTKYEVQAIQYSDLARQCAENKFMIFILNGTGEVLEKIEPA